jgi:fatty-acid desaturase
VSMSHVSKDPVLLFFEKYYLLINLLYATILFAINPSYVIYFYVIPVIYGHMGLVWTIINHGGFLGGENNSKRHKGYNKFLGWWLFYGEQNHSDHHDNPSRDDELNIMLRRVFDGQSSR